MAPSAILRSPNCESGRILWHLRHIRVMNTSFPSASKTADRRRRGLGLAGTSSAFPAEQALPREIAGATITFTTIEADLHYRAGIPLLFVGSCRTKPTVS